MPQKLETVLNHEEEINNAVNTPISLKNTKSSVINN